MNAIGQFSFIESNAYEGVMGDISLDSSYRPDIQKMALEYDMNRQSHQLLDKGLDFYSRRTTDFTPIYLSSSDDTFQAIS